MGGQQRRVPYRPLVIVDKNRDGFSSDEEKGEEKSRPSLASAPSSGLSPIETAPVSGLQPPHNGLKIPLPSSSPSSPLSSPTTEGGSNKLNQEPLKQGTPPPPSIAPVGGKDTGNRLKAPGRSSLPGPSAPRSTPVLTETSGLAQPTSRLHKMVDNTPSSSSSAAGGGGSRIPSTAGKGDAGTTSTATQPSIPQPRARSSSDTSAKTSPVHSSESAGEEDQKSALQTPRKASGLAKPGTGMRLPQAASHNPSPLLKTSAPTTETEDKGRGPSKLQQLTQVSGSKLAPRSGSKQAPSSSDQSTGDAGEGTAVPKLPLSKSKLTHPPGSKLGLFKQPARLTSSSPTPSPVSSNAPSQVSTPTEQENIPSPCNSKTSLLSSNESLEAVKFPPPPKGFEEPHSDAAKPNIPLPLNITGTVDPPTTAPPTTIQPDTLSSTSSISSTNSQSESTTAEIHTPSPLGGRKYCRRTSPEGMSVDETASPRDSKEAHLSSESLGEEDAATAKEAFATAREALRERNQLAQFMAGVRREPTDLAQQQVAVTQQGDSLVNPHASPAKDLKRARSLSPKSSHRIYRVPLLAGATSATEPSSGKDDKEGHKEKVKPARSALRGTKSSRGDLHVTISPHSSEESFSSSDNSLSKGTSVPIERRAGGVEGQSERRISQTERPKSMEELESHKFSQQAFPGDLHGLLARHGSTRSDQLDYSEVASFLMPGRLQKLAQARREQDGNDSTPEVGILVVRCMRTAPA